MKGLTIFNNEDFKVKIKQVDNELFFDAEMVARSLGLTTVAKSGNTCVRWSRVGEYLADVKKAQAYEAIKKEEYSDPDDFFEACKFKIEYDTERISKGDYITESEVYMLAMKANNQTAINFQIWLATEVIPTIRKYGVYIAPDATKEEVDKLEQFSKYRIKKTFAAATEETIEKLFNDFIEFTAEAKASDRLIAYKSAIKGINEFKDNNTSTIALFTATEKLRVLTELKNKTENRINGGQKAYKTKLINQYADYTEDLENYISYIDPDLSEFTTLNIHPFTVNKMYAGYKETGEIRKTLAYNVWIKKFPKIHFDLKQDKKYKIYCYYECLEKYDVDNFSKSLIDQISNINNIDDKIFIEIVSKRVKIVNDYNEGKIHVCIKEI